MSNPCFSWHTAILDQLNLARQTGRIAHGLLFHGPAGVGKHHFARVLAKSLFCSHPTSTGEGCDACRSCRQFDAQTHPDFLYLTPEEGKGQIRIDQVRDLTADLGLTAFYGGLKIAVIDPAEAMNPFAANSLLKTLEEPPADSLIVLVTEQPGRLLPTIRSRCQMIRFDLPAQSTAQAWLLEQGHAADAADIGLGYAEGAPLLAERFLTENLVDMDANLDQELADLILNRTDAVTVADGWNRNYPLDLVMRGMIGRTRAPFISKTPGPRITLPSTVNGRFAVVPSGQTVS